MIGRKKCQSVWIATGRGVERRSHRNYYLFIYLFVAASATKKEKRKKSFRLGFSDGTNEFCLKLITSLILIDLEAALARQIKVELQHFYAHLGQKIRDKFPF